MNTMLKSCNGISLIPLDSRLFSERKLFLEGEITQTSADEFVKEIMFLVGEDPRKPIDVYINSPGGEVMAGLLIYDTLKGIETVVDLHCTGIAASMAAIILAGGKKGHRHILKHSRTMVHEPLLTNGMGGSATSIKRTAESIMETKRLSVALLAADTGRTWEEVEEAISFDNYMNAEEAVAFGLCDDIETSIVK